MFFNALLIAALPLIAPITASSIQKRDDVDVFIWGNANLTDYSTEYTFSAGTCQAIATPTSGQVGSATVDMNARCDIYASTNCAGPIAGSFSAPGISDTGALGQSFRALICSIPSGMPASSTAIP
ncbi:hypothetical protein BGW36DRAFT_394451 [Talaromyces proteolyticus]|uniref:Uncharacterized protein n=1 Tax=Talaromyces proteolyticus TaxID=1131652 RepID=A0AAD4KXZ1_9EURO|nr:uncharacterized protein BGW36DRAFT_394451 [Talaromyces proteolyticus]KAH8701597.1 hypothetical protein BGW36DRAFT_394451 [Talaromyces proteolyticus]